MEEWVVLKLETQTNPISHSPWICCSLVWPEGQNYTMETHGWRGRVLLPLTSIHLTSLPIIFWCGVPSSSQGG